MVDKKERDKRRREELFKKFKKHPQNADRKEITEMLELYGFEYRGATGDHYMYKRTGFRTIPVPFKNPVILLIVKEILKAVQEVRDQEI